jgi:hypothetical protein
MLFCLQALHGKQNVFNQEVDSILSNNNMQQLDMFIHKFQDWNVLWVRISSMVTPVPGLGDLGPISCFGYEVSLNLGLERYR